MATSKIMKVAQTGFISKNIIIGFLILFGLVVAVWAMLPSAFSTNLERVGQGIPAIVLVYDMDDGHSHKLMEGYNAIRHNYEGQVEFFVADAGHPKGQAFIRTHQANLSSAIHFSGDGKQVMVIHSGQDEKVLIESIKKAFDI